MNKESYIKLYYDWLTELIDLDDKVNLYEHLLEHLFNVDFIWLESIPLDRNRAVDGLGLRKAYAKLLGPTGGDIFLNILNNKPCSMLEMLVAFADRLTGIVTIGKSEFFWMFIDNLGLGWATEYDFDRDIVNDILHDFMFGTIHGQEPKGKENPPVLFPCREVYSNLDSDLYMQANLYLKSYFL